MNVLPRRAFTCVICKRVLDKTYKDQASHREIGEVCKRCVISACYPKGFTSRHKARYSQIKSSATSRKLGFDISQQHYLEKVARECAYCGSVNDTLGLDRLDSTMGYTPDNTVSCCRRCNSAKNNMPVVDFEAWVKKVHNFLPNWPKTR